ncbi:MAG: alpha/beta hydrolase [Mycobacteriaceae bacterium]
MHCADALSVDGTRIAYLAAGDPDGAPLVLLHGWAQSADCWGADLLAELSRRYRVIAVDLRGHGRSGTPERGYDDPALWAADVAAVLAAAAITTPPVLLAWSYGGLVACDYLAAGGRIAGLILVGAITGLGRGKAGGRVGSAMRGALPDALSTDTATAVAALARFGDALVSPDDGARAQGFLGTSLATPPHVRAALFARECDHDRLLAALDVPALVLHGTADTVVDPRAGEHAAGLIPHREMSLWEGIGHAPFAVDPQRFVAEITAFAARAHAGAGRMDA